MNSQFNLNLTITRQIDMVLYNLASECGNLTSFSNELVMKTNSQGHFNKFDAFDANVSVKHKTIKITYLITSNYLVKL